MSRIVIHLRPAARSLLRTPGFTASAIAALALGIASNTAIFSVVNKVLLEPLPYPDPDRMVQLMTDSPLGKQTVVSIPKFVTWRRHTTMFQHMAAYDIGGPAVTLTPGDPPLKAGRVSADYFRLFGAEVEVGRTFSEAEDGPRGPCAIVISDRLWRNRFGRNPALPGSAIPVGQGTCHVVGVLAPGVPMEPPVDIWFPLQADPNSTDHGSRVRVVARLLPGVRLKEADTELWQTIGPFTRRFPNAPLLFHESFTAIPLRDAIVGDVGRALWMLVGAVACVLLISCANVGSLVLARSSRRAREIAIRTALGAKRDQIVWQLLTESLLLAAAGGALGLALGSVGVRELLAWSPAAIPRVGAGGAAITLDWRVFLFTLAVSIASGAIFGLAPAIQASRADVSSLVNDNAAQSGMGFRRGRGRAVLVIVEVALSVVLLAGAGLLIRTFVAMRTVNRGFDERNVLTLEVSLAGSRFDSTASLAWLANEAERRIRNIPGVSMAAAATTLPTELGMAMPFTVIRHDQTLVGRYHGVAAWNSVSPGFFDVFRIRLLRGRGFTAADDATAIKVVMINRAMLRKYWQEVDANPVGEFIVIGKDAGPGLEDAPRQIVGIVSDVEEAGLGAPPHVYVPLAQAPDAMTARNTRLRPMAWVVRTAINPHGLAAAIERELRQAGGGLPIEGVRTMEEATAESSGRARFYAMLLSVFAGIALLLVAVGLYGLLAYSVEERTREIGVRIALGARPEDIWKMVVSDGMRLAGLGILGGIPAALGLARAMTGLIFGIRTWDPTVFAVVAALLAAVALAATWSPSLRATRVNPLEALRR